MFSLVKNISDSILAAIEKFSSGKSWALKITILAFFLSLFSAFPSYDIFFNNYDQYKHHWHGIHDQINDPFTFKQYSPLHHSANTTFRLTVPILAHFLGLGSTDLFYQILFCLGLQLIALFVLLWTITNIAFKITKDKIVACLICLSFALIYTGNSLPGDLWGGMDVAGYCLLALAIVSNNLLLIILFIILASFVDERALICTCLIFLWHRLKDKNTNDLQVRDFFYLNKTTASVVIGWIIYFGLKYSLEEFRGFKLNVFTADVAIVVFKEVVSNVPMGVAFALEGLWLIVLASLLILLTEKRWITLLLISGGIFLVSFVSFCILDISRSIAYIFPVVFVSLYIVAKKENILTLRYFSLWTMMLCLFPTYYVFGERHAQWLYPFPLQLLRMITGSETFSLTF